VGRLAELAVVLGILITLGHKVVRPELHTLESVDRLILLKVPVLLDQATVLALVAVLSAAKRVLPEHRVSFVFGSIPNESSYHI
jgi:hypothetical protein